MTAIDAAFSLVFVALLGVALFFVAMACSAVAVHSQHGNDDGMCAPSRRANITASVPQAQQRVMQLGRIDATYTVPFPLPAVVHAPQTRRQPAGDYAVPRPADVDVIRANSRTYRPDELATPAPAPLAVDDWPTRQTVEAEPVPVVGNWTAARFEHLELRGASDELRR